MKITRRRRVARKLVLPLLAVGLMTAMQYLGSVKRSTQQQSSAAPAAAARAAHGLRQR